MTDEKRDLILKYLRLIEEGKFISDTRETLGMFYDRIEKETKEKVLNNKDRFWLNGITRELNYGQRVIGKIKIEDLKELKELE